jgi:chorismate mutase / prephenate dehydratase
MKSTSKLKAGTTPARVARVNVAYFGKPGSYSHEVALRRFFKSAAMTPRRTITEVFEAVANDEVGYGVVPIENTLGGPIFDTVDQLIREDFGAAGLVICEELSLHVTLSLLGRKNIKPKRIYSHFVPLKHCSDWLRSRYPEAAILETESTSEAVERAAVEGDAWAIGNTGAAALHHLDVIVPRLGSRAQNITRFYLVGKKPPAPKTGNRTLLVFGLIHQPGSLVQALQALAKFHVNMTRIVSRALPNNPDEYLFVVECEGNPQQANFIKALALLRTCSTNLRILGSFRVVEKFE